MPVNRTREFVPEDPHRLLGSRLDGAAGAVLVRRAQGMPAPTLGHMGLSAEAAWMIAHGASQPCGPTHSTIGL
jgi:hypothetical protein